MRRITFEDFLETGVRKVNDPATLTKALNTEIGSPNSHLSESAIREEFESFILEFNSLLKQGIPLGQFLMWAKAKGLEVTFSNFTLPKFTINLKSTIWGCESESINIYAGESVKKVLATEYKGLSWKSIKVNPESEAILSVESNPENSENLSRSVDPVKESSLSAFEFVKNTIVNSNHGNTSDDSLQNFIEIDSFSDDYERRIVKKVDSLEDLIEVDDFMEKYKNRIVVRSFTRADGRGLYMRFYIRKLKNLNKE